ncbi:MAG TPA: hypothetical protein VM261_28860 [Kofleriaceae bacterium]|nr:hypothetical protein [Kofleriaceae bacterium]
MRRGLGLLIAVHVVTGTALAQPARRSAIVIVETRGAPSLPTLASQLEVHGAGSASIETRSERGADPIAFIGTASEIVARGDADLVVWIAPTDGGYLVFAAGPWPDRALIELARLDAGIEPAELERTIALKVAGLLDTLRAQAQLPATPTTTTTPATPATRAKAAASARDRRWRIEAAGLVARESHDRALDGRTALAVGRTWPMGTWELTPSLAGYWQPSGTIEGDGGRVAITELGAIVAIEASRSLGAVDALVRPRLTLAVLRARGQSEDGRRGRATVPVPYGGAELGVRRTLAPAVWAGVVAGVEAAAIHQKFLVDDEAIADLGRIRLHVGVMLSVGL